MKLTALAQEMNISLKSREHLVSGGVASLIKYNSESITSNQTALARVLQYHIAAGSYPADALMINMTEVATTLASADMLGESTLSFFESLADIRQVMHTRHSLCHSSKTSLVRPSSSDRTLPCWPTQLTKTSSSSSSTVSFVSRIMLCSIDCLLIRYPAIPGPVPEVIAANGGDAFTGYLNSLLPDVVQTLNSTAGITVFSPNNEAASSRAADITGLPADQITPAIQQHVLQGVYYSPNITDGLSLPTLAGNEMMFTVNVGWITRPVSTLLKLCIGHRCLCHGRRCFRSSCRRAS